MNSPILVGLDVLGIGTRCLGEENKLASYEEDITAAGACAGTLWLGSLGMMAITREGLAITAIS